MTPRTTEVLLCTRDSNGGRAKQAGVTLGGKAAIEVLKKVEGRVLIDINKRSV